MVGDIRKKQSVVKLLVRLGSFFDTTFWLMAFVALVTRSLYLTVAGWQEVLVYVLGHAIFYRALYWLIAERFSPWKTALIWLGSPLLLFSAIWLQPIWALVFTACWAAALWWSLCQHPKEVEEPSSGVIGYLILLGWVSLCGAGGYGFQSWDYQLHNGRLLDLINSPWPVYYASSDGSEQVLVQYAAYYLWPALAGKLFGEPMAMLVQHLWLLVGCWIVLRITMILTRIKYSWFVAIGLVLFGGWSFIGWLFFLVGSAPYEDLVRINTNDFLQLLRTQLEIPGMPVWLSFWPTTQVAQGVWFGNAISLASSMLWAPNQTVAGWIVVGLLCRACQLQKVREALFACALLAYWSPMIALGLFPAVLLLALRELLVFRNSKQYVVSIAVGVSVLAVLGIYYMSVPVGSQPHGVLFSGKIRIFPFLLFLLQSWGVYATVIVLYRHCLNKSMQLFAGAIFCAALVASSCYYGVNNDFMVRSSAALFFGIFLTMLRILQALLISRAYAHVVFLAVILLVSIPEGALEVWQAVTHADVRIRGESVIDYEEGWQFLGKQDSWFVRYLAADFYPPKS